MSKALGSVCLMVNDYDEAIAYFTERLGFVLREDTKLEMGKRWVVVAPDTDRETGILLAKATSPEQTLAIGNQCGGRVFLFLRTENFWRDFAFMKERGVKFHEEPRQEAYGMVAVFEDLYGNKWDLLGRS